MNNDPGLRQMAMAIFSGFVGIAFSSYSNQVIGQAPSGIVCFMSIGFIWLAYRWDRHAKPPVLQSSVNQSS